VRYPAETPTLAVIRDGIHLESIPDFHGRPPVYRRLRLSPGSNSIETAASLNGIDFRTVGQPVPLNALGPLLQIGILTSRRTSIESTPHPLTRFLFLGRDFFP
jgi:hypothetical protein